MKLYKIIIVWAAALLLTVFAIKAFADRVTPLSIEPAYVIVLPNNTGRIVCIPLDAQPASNVTALACMPIVNTELCAGFTNSDIQCATLTMKRTAL